MLPPEDEVEVEDYDENDGAEGGEDEEDVDEAGELVVRGEGPDVGAGVVGGSGHCDGWEELFGRW